MSYLFNLINHITSYYYGNPNLQTSDQIITNNNVSVDENNLSHKALFVPSDKELIEKYKNLKHINLSNNEKKTRILKHVNVANINNNLLNEIRKPHILKHVIHIPVISKDKKFLDEIINTKKSLKSINEPKIKDDIHKTQKSLKSILNNGTYLNIKKSKLKRTRSLNELMS